MRQMERRGNPSGRRSSATFSKNALTLLPFTLFMSWWTPATSKHMRQRRMDCLTGLLPWCGGTVVFNWWDPSKRKLSFFSSLPATEETGLHRVHPTWAGTFVLAALVAIFPGINFILLDSDCLPITLFEAADLWKEGFLTRFPPGAGKGLPQRKRDYVNRPDVVYTQHRVDADRQGSLIQ